MLRNDWIENEVRILKKEIHCKKQRKDYMFLKMLGILMLLLFFTINAFGDIYPYSYQEIETYEEINTGFFPDTWRCSNPKCRYENYEGIDYCALCGTKRK